MDPMTAIAASGLRARMESLDMLANNIANASTGGYKADREFYSLYMAPEAAGRRRILRHAADRDGLGSILSQGVVAGDRQHVSTWRYRAKAFSP